MTPAMTSHDAGVVHQPSDPLLPASSARSRQFRLHPQHAVGLSALLMNAADLLHQHGICSYSS